MTFRRFFRWFLILLLLATAAYLVWLRLQPRPVQVVVAEARRGTVERLVANTRAGTVEACRRADLSPGTGGQISLLPVQKGDRVAAGELLVELWNRDLEARVRLAESELAASRARLLAARRQRAAAERELARLGPLHGAGVVAAETYDRAETEADIRRAEEEAARAAEKASAGQLGVLEAEFERTRLVAPFAGIVAEINGEENEYVTPSPPGIATPPTVILLDTSCFYVTAPIDEVDAAAISVGHEARVSLDAFGERLFAGRVRQIDPYVLDREKQARTVDVEVEFLTPPENAVLLAGYSADVEIVLERRENALQVPTQALLDGNRLFVFDKASGLLRKRQVETGLANWEVTEIVSGLEAGELVVLSTDRAGVADGARAQREAEK